MSNSNFLEFQTTSGDHVIPGVWKLAPGWALSMVPRQAGVLRVAQGQVWVTLDAALTAAIDNEGAVARPLRDLGLALGMVGTALVHLGGGVLAYARQMVLGRSVVVQAPHCS